MSKPRLGNWTTNQKSWLKSIDLHTLHVQIQIKNIDFYMNFIDAELLEWPQDCMHMYWKYWFWQSFSWFWASGATGPITGTLAKSTLPWRNSMENRWKTLAINILAFFWCFFECFLYWFGVCFFFADGNRPIHLMKNNISNIHSPLATIGNTTLWKYSNY